MRIYVDLCGMNKYNHFMLKINEPLPLNHTLLKDICVVWVGIIVEGF